MKKVLLVLTILAGSSTFAAKNIWRDCGIGALIFSGTPWAAVTSNIIWDLGLTGSLSTSSSEDQCAGKGASVGKFLYQNYALIEEQTIIGKGEHLAALFNILDCNKQGREEITRELRSNLSDYIQSNQYENSDKMKKVQSFYNEFMSKAQSSKSANCSAS